MFIINKFNIESTSNALIASNDANINTGVTSVTWVGCNPSFEGDTGNAPVGDGLINITGVYKYDTQVIQKVLSITFTGTLLVGKDNYVRIPLSQIGLSNFQMIISANVTGAYDPNFRSGATPTPVFIQAHSSTNLVYIVNGNLEIKIFNNHQGLFQNKVVHLVISYY